MRRGAAPGAPAWLARAAWPARAASASAAPASPQRLRRWAVAGALIGAMAAVAVFAPAAWLAQTVAQLSGGRVLLADARGTVWAGDAAMVLTAGAGARDASVLPGRLHWQLGWRDGAFELALRHRCCLQGSPRLRIEPGFGRLAVALTPSRDDAADDVIGRWPAALLGGLGTPFNTLQLAGELRLASPGLRLERVLGRWQVHGSAQLALADVASRLTTLPRLGSYRLDIEAPEAGAGGAALRVALVTEAGPLHIDATGQWAASGLRLRGEARAEPGSEAALDNLLNIIGRRQGDLSRIAIG